MKEIEIIDTPGQRAKLTVTPMRVSMKFPHTMTPEDRRPLLEFFTMVATVLRSEPTAMRGSLHPHTGVLEMQNTARTVTRTFLKGF